ncbi:hypothetical protein [Piscinibacter gummiphilus]|uniref:Uncharacterized protein n=1 Tax=Piscinibacter gummiphilus TaxID=946333 RepID=A0A1W6LDV9_9BURK|nr:hypothetical protein [Piscinibacter gummiphilus]ARN22430.1 hypothetical protein A4W93_22375 [Piscinibacter gummiphilus]GLS98008.1 hypothetical protein GCM10007918_53000 [Piscinibacter gummiphilus]
MTQPHHPTRRDVLATLLAVGLAGCGGGEPDPPAAYEHAVTGRAAVKVRRGGPGLVVLEERLVSIHEQGPQRQVVLLTPDWGVMGRYTAPADWSIVDAAAHPSGETSVVLTQRKTVRLVRLDVRAVVVADQPFTDAAAATDPYFDLGGIEDPTSLQPYLMRDAARLAPLGEDLALVLRTGRNAVVAYRLARSATGWTTAWRTLVEPGSTAMGRFLSGGSFDTFGQLENHLRVHVDVATDGGVVVGVAGVGGHNAVMEAHAWHFGEPVTARHGVLITRLTADGQRVGTTVVDTGQITELHALRWSAGEVAVAGRVRSAVVADGSGWNAFAAFAGPSALTAAPVLVDVDRGEVLFDIAPLPNRRWLACGTAGYVQNPAGASISEVTTPLLVTIDADSGQVGRLNAWADGPRQLQLRSLVVEGGRWLAAGITNGPGTHSHDADPLGLTADGFVHRADRPPEG